MMKRLDCALDNILKMKGSKILAVVLSLVLILSLSTWSTNAFADEASGVKVTEEVEGAEPGSAAVALSGEEPGVTENGTEAEQTIVDDENPLAAFDAPQCWVHLFMIIGLICTVVYAGAVVARRLGHARKIDKFDHDITGPAETKQTVPRTAVHHA